MPCAAMIHAGMLLLITKCVGLIQIVQKRVAPRLIARSHAATGQKQQS